MSTIFCKFERNTQNLALKFIEFEVFQEVTIFIFGYTQFLKKNSSISVHLYACHRPHRHVMV